MRQLKLLLHGGITSGWLTTKEANKETLFTKLQLLEKIPQQIGSSTEIKIERAVATSLFSKHSDKCTNYLISRSVGWMGHFEGVVQ
jgi:hypothetical protein